MLSEIAPGVLVGTSPWCRTNSTVIVSGNECLVVDPGVAVAEIVALGVAVRGHGLTVTAGFSTHAHWDHVLWHSDLGEVPRYATARAVEAAHTNRAELLAELAADAPGHDLRLVGALTPLPEGADRLPWPGTEAVVVAHDGHSAGHAALFLPDTGVLICGDMCSDIEIPLLDLTGADPLGDYSAGLDRLAALPVRHVVCGHGSVGDATAFHERVAADRRYLDGLRRNSPCADARLTEPWLVRESEKQRARLHP
ncbi:MBL fold metallo-hydrolase [Nocardiopsis ansamitocini]|uniref:MBL fold metallo-hydrolase n=1 Tax=Nocardiopsis ansamitocini TaxID=1670832 RepID=A0A9W6P665_9ACTN|nr:MBL fold metallo-hydrolase [Nocardiopsis ansamitocini]GLU47781.1 MBL fold metallo-hydrolase [Nocardiopsis ansamitocini]